MQRDLTGSDDVSLGKSTSRYWDGRFKRHVLKLLPGEYAVGVGGEMIVTVLGSCVAACIYENVLGVGGMNHFMLPLERSQQPGSNRVTDYNSPTARYGNVAMERLINEIIKIGGMRYNLEAKIFGGARITNSSTDIGAGNISFVREYLKLEGIRIINEDIGGVLPRKVYYIPSTNDVFVKKIERADYSTIITKENECLTDLKEEKIKGKIFFLDT